MGSDLALTGIVSNLDWGALVDKLIAADARPLQLMQQKQNNLQAVSGAWKDINTRLLNLQTQASNLADATKLYASTASSSDTTVLDVTASSSAATGFYSINVQKLAQANIVGTNVYSSADAALGQSGAVQIAGKTVQIDTTDTLNTLAAKINAISGIGVSASVVQLSSNQWQMLLTSKTTGAAGQITFVDDNSALSNLGLLDPANQIQAAQDAQITINNSLTVYRSSNTISDVIPGVTLTLKKAGASASVTTGPDTDAVIKMVHDFVDQYNSVMDFIDQKASYDTKAKQAGVLFGDPTVQMLQSRLRSLVTDRVPGSGTYSNLAAIGVDLGKWGTPNFGRLQVDDTKLRDAINTNIDAVGVLFGVNEANVALGQAGSTATADSTAAGSDPANVINGRTDASQWGTAGVGWTDGTQGAFPDTLTVNFGTTRTIDHVVIQTLDSQTYPASQYGIRDFTVDYFNGSSWVNIANVTGNQQGVVTVNLGAAVQAQQLRLTVTASNTSGSAAMDGYSRVMQVQAFQKGLGVGSRLTDFLNTYTTTQTGILDTKQQALKQQMDDISKSMESMQERLQMRRDTMRQQFIAMEQTLAKLKEQSSALNGLILNNGQ